MSQDRRKFIKQASRYTAGMALMAGAPFLLNSCGKEEKNKKPIVRKPHSILKPNELFRISLAQWSFHRALEAGKMSTLQFPLRAKKDFGIDAVEYVSRFFEGKEEDAAYLSELKTICDSEGVNSLLIMVDDEGDLGDLNKTRREVAIKNHHKWVNAAKSLGCHSIRVNAAGKGTETEVASAAVEGLGDLAEYAAKENINVIVENHGGFSSNGAWLANVLGEVNRENCGSLPDFGNFCIQKIEDSKANEHGIHPCKTEYDRYQGVRELMTFAKGVSAKSHAFDEKGNELYTDYSQMLSIVLESGYRGYVGIEFEGNSMSERDGIISTLKLLERVRGEMSR